MLELFNNSIHLILVSFVKELALVTYNNQEYQGKTITVSPSIVKQHMAVPVVAPPRGGGRGRGRGGGRGDRGRGGERGRGSDRGRGRVEMSSRGGSNRSRESFTDQRAGGRSRGSFSSGDFGLGHISNGGARFTDCGNLGGRSGGYGQSGGGYNQGGGGYGIQGAGGYNQFGGGGSGYGQGEGGYGLPGGNSWTGGFQGQDYWQGSNVGPMRGGFTGQQSHGGHRYMPY